MRKFFLLLFCLSINLLYASVGHYSLSGNGWTVFLDKDAVWQKDRLFLPDELPHLSKLDIHKPTCGWDKLYKSGKSCSLPASVEEIFGESNRWTYHGVSWFYRSFMIPKEWENSNCFLRVGQYRQRIEIYVNEKLAGYDVVGMVPYKCDITKYLKYGENNNIAFRITNPGGCRGWGDFVSLSWGNTDLLSDKDFSGIGGDVTIDLSSKVNINDVFVKNILPAGANNIQINTYVDNLNNSTFCGKINISIIDPSNKKIIASKKDNVCFYSGKNECSLQLNASSAKLWDFDSPNLYECKVTVSDNSGELCSDYSQTFGFRVFEVKKVAGQNNFYLNGERIRFKSAIDWGIYAFTGMYAKPEVAKRSILSVKQVGHNSLNCHRHIGDALLLNYADSLGVGIYEEPGGFHCGGQKRNIDKNEFMRKQIYERIARMVVRDRNHPSLLIYTLCNEDNLWTLSREYAMRLIQKLDGTRLVVNSSGGNGGGYMDYTNHLRPYESEIRADYCDNHTVFSGVYFNDGDLNYSFNAPAKRNKNQIDHYTTSDSTIIYWGEVRCFPGIFNNNLIYHQNKSKGGYDLNLFHSQAQKVDDLFNRCNMYGLANGNIKSSEDITKQAARGQMYTDGRLGQRILSCSSADGYAINGWSPGPDVDFDWSSALTDLNRNINGPAFDMSYWNRPLQIAIFRIGGKYFKPGEDALFQISLINENKLKSGDYLLNLSLTDGAGNKTKYLHKIAVNVKGGDCFAQNIVDSLRIKMNSNWAPGYITLHGVLMKNNKIVADGLEQVLLQNRKMESKNIREHSYMICNWSKALQAIKDAGLKIDSKASVKSIILLGKDVSEKDFSNAVMLAKNGARVIMQMDTLSAQKLYNHKILSKEVTCWGGLQTPHWRGNGAAYIGDLLDSQSFPSHGVVSTRSWEVNSDPRGFWPFESNYKLSAYGLYFSNHQDSDKKFNDDNNTLVMIGGIKYGKGFILLSSCYFVDDDKPFNDMLFYGMLKKISQL